MPTSFYDHLPSRQWCQVGRRGDRRQWLVVANGTTEVHAFEDEDEARAFWVREERGRRNCTLYQAAPMRQHWFARLSAKMRRAA